MRDEVPSCQLASLPATTVVGEGSDLVWSGLVELVMDKVDEGGTLKISEKEPPDGTPVAHVRVLVRVRGERGRGGGRGPFAPLSSVAYRVRYVRPPVLCACIGCLVSTEWLVRCSSLACLVCSCYGVVVVVMVMAMVP